MMNENIQLVKGIPISLDKFAIPYFKSQGCCDAKIAIKGDDKNAKQMLESHLLRE